MSICAACNTLTKADDQLLKCTYCTDQYHFECLNIKTNQHSGITHDYKAKWKCPSCCNVSLRKRSTTNTPVYSSQLHLGDETLDMSCDVHECAATPPTQSILFRNNNLIDASDENFLMLSQDLTNTLQGWRVDINNTMTEFKENIKSSLQECRTEIEESMSKFNDGIKNALLNIKQELATLCCEQAGLKQSVKEVSSELNNLKESAQFNAEEQCVLKKRIEDLENKIAGLSSSSISHLEWKIDSLEQQARQCNVEICNVPDKRGEDLMKIMDSICMTVGFTLPRKDILSIHRVPHAQPLNNNPKNIVVKLSSRIMRDNLLAAFRRKKNLKSDQVGISGTPTTIYMNEHLTLKNKYLFRKCREAAKLHNYKYVWSKNASILVREKDGCSAFVVRTEQDLCKIKSKTGQVTKLPN